MGEMQSALYYPFGFEERIRTKCTVGLVSIQDMNALAVDFIFDAFRAGRYDGRDHVIDTARGLQGEDSFNSSRIYDC